MAAFQQKTVKVRICNYIDTLLVSAHYYKGPVAVLADLEQIIQGAHLNGTMYIVECRLLFSKYGRLEARLPFDG